MRRRTNLLVKIKLTGHKMKNVQISIGNCEKRLEDNRWWYVHQNRRWSLLSFVVSQQHLYTSYVVLLVVLQQQPLPAPSQWVPALVVTPIAAYKYWRGTHQYFGNLCANLLPRSLFLVHCPVQYHNNSRIQWESEAVSAVVAAAVVVF